MRFAWDCHHRTRSGARRHLAGKITAPNMDAARETLLRRAEKSGRSKIDLRLVDITHIEEA